MPVCHQNHGGVPMTVSVVLCGLDQLFNLSLGQVLSAAKLAVRPAPQGNCSFLGGWLHQPQVPFCWHSRLLSLSTVRTTDIIRAVRNRILDNSRCHCRLMVPQRKAAQIVSRGLRLAAGREKGAAVGLE